MPVALESNRQQYSLTSARLSRSGVERLVPVRAFRDSISLCYVDDLIARLTVEITRLSCPLAGVCCHWKYLLRA